MSDEHVITTENANALREARTRIEIKHLDALRRMNALTDVRSPEYFTIVGVAGGLLTARDTITDLINSAIDVDEQQVRVLKKYIDTTVKAAKWAIK
jgi:hypothetical protein